MFKLNKNSLFFGYILIIFSLLFGSLRPILIQFGLLKQGVSPVLMLSLTAIIAALFALFSHKITIPDKKHFNALIIAGILLFINSLAVILALKNLSVVSVSIIIALTPLIVAIHTSILKNKPPGNNFVWGFCLAFFGVLMVLDILNDNSFTFNIIGVCLSALAVLASDFYRITLEEVTSNISSKQASQYVLLIGGLLGLIILPFNNINTFYADFNTILIICLIGLFAFLANLFFVKAIQTVGSTKVSMIYISKPAVIAFLAFILFNLSLSPVQILGILFIIFGLFIYEFDIKNAVKSLLGYFRFNN